MARLDEVDLSRSLPSAEEGEQLRALGDRFAQLRLALGGKFGDDPGVLGPPVCVVMEGWDASGKGGAIKRLVAPLDARHVRVATYAAPTADELRHFYLHRFVGALPGTGGLTIFDRSWYGRVLVERVEGFATQEEWRRAYHEINEFERMLAASGMVFVKIWLHISDKEQLKRFKKREKDPLKRWKLTPDDWRNREKRPAYEEAVEEMFEKTSIPEAPWHIVPAESKPYARAEVIRTVIAEIERGCAVRGFPLPEPLEDAA